MRCEKPFGVPEWVGELVSDLPPLLTTTEAVTVLRCSPRSLYRRVAEGRIHAVRVAEKGSSRLLVPRSEIERFLTELALAA